MLKPLRGIKVVDVTRVLAGPWCTQLLADLGADVIKVESFGGDETRQWAPPFCTAAVGERASLSTYFASCNRGKRSISIDLKTSTGKNLLRELVVESKADVFIHNFTAKSSRALGCDYDSFKHVDHGLIYAEISGYGPQSSRPAYDVMISAVGGMLSITGEEGAEAEPCKPGVALTDILTGTYCANAISSALFERQQRLSRGERVAAPLRINTTLLGTQIAALANVGSAFLNAGVVGGRRGSAHQSIVPYQAFRCKDEKYIVVGALNNFQWARLLRALSSHVGHSKEAQQALAALQSSSSFVDNPARVANRNECIAHLRLIFSTLPSNYWTDLLTSEVPVGRVNSVDEVFACEEVRQLNAVVELDGGIKTIKSPVSISTETAEANADAVETLYASRPPPLLSEHALDILQSIGVSQRRIQLLHEAKVVLFPDFIKK